MAKMHKKSDLIFDEGYVLDSEGNVIGLPKGVASQLNDLETAFQKLTYLDRQPEAKPEPSLDGFKRKTVRMTPVLEPETPMLDKKVKEGKKILKEIRRIDTVGKANEMLMQYRDALEFLKRDKFVSSDEIVLIDTPVLGDILEIDVDDLIDRIIDFLD